MDLSQDHVQGACVKHLPCAAAFAHSGPGGAKGAGSVLCSSASFGTVVPGELREQAQCCAALRPLRTVVPGELRDQAQCRAALRPLRTVVPGELREQAQCCAALRPHTWIHTTSSQVGVSLGAVTVCAPRQSAGASRPERVLPRLGRRGASAPAVFFKVL